MITSTVVEGQTSPDQAYDTVCYHKYCPICQVPQLRNSSLFIIRGICKESPMDRFYVLNSSVELIGLMNNRIIFSETENNWKIVNHIGEV